MTVTPLTIWFLLTGILQAPAQKNHPDFTGIWKANESRTIGQDREESESIEQTDTTCKIVYQMRQLDFRPMRKFVLDGRDQVNGGTTSNAHWEGSSLILDTRSKGGGHLVTTHESLALSDDGKILVKSVESTHNGVTSTGKIVFEKISDDTTPRHFRAGSAEDDVRKAWGAPDEVQEGSAEKKYVYFNWLCGRSRMCKHTVTIIDGKVTTIQ